MYHSKHAHVSQLSCIDARGLPCGSVLMAFADVPYRSCLCTIFTFIRQGRVQDIPHEILEHRDRVRVLDLSCNRFTELPASLGLITNLEKLTATQNSISSIQVPLGSLSRLKVPSRYLDHAQRSMLLIDRMLFVPKRPV